MTEPRASDARRHPRVRLTHPVRLTFSNRPDETTSHTANISESGMFVAGTKVPPIGTMVRFAIDFGIGGGESHPEEVVRGHGQVVWMRLKSKRLDEPCGMGIEFGTLHERATELLRHKIGLALEELSVASGSSVAAGG